jgi:flagellar biogenesis protein FliO
MANLDVILMVVSVVSFVLLLIFVATYCLNKLVDRSAP